MSETQTLNKIEKMNPKKFTKKFCPLEVELYTVTLSVVSRTKLELRITVLGNELAYTSFVEKFINRFYENRANV